MAEQKCAEGGFMPASAKQRSVCPVSCTLDLIGDKWTLLVIRDLFSGKRKFNDFTQSPEHIATNILTERLTRLEEHGLVERQTSDAHAGRYDYVLTAKGLTLLPVLQALAAWGLKHIEGTAALIKVVPQQRRNPQK
jgi:DNA-binding HxlR family transcriptional regulator